MLPSKQQNNNVPAKTVVPMVAFKQYINGEGVQKSLAQSLGENKNMFVTSLTEVFSGDTKLQQCDPQAIVAEAVKAASLKLPLNKQLGFAYLLPFKNQGVMTPTMVIGWKGFVQLAMRTGQYKYINCDVVCEGELRRMNKLTGEIDINGEVTSDKIIGYFAYFQLINGFEKTIYISVSDMAKYAKKFSPTLKFAEKITVDTLVELALKNESTGIGWIGDFTSMALKTCVRRLLSKYGVLSIEMQQALTDDENPLPPVDIKSEVVETTATIQIDATVNEDTGEVTEEAEAQPQGEAAEQQPTTEQTGEQPMPGKLF